MERDLYAWTVRIDPETGEYRNKATHIIQKWKNNLPLFHWMETLYHHKGGKGPFHYVSLLLTPEDIANLERDLRNGNGALRDGFFFGTDEGDGTLAFVARAQVAHAEGCAVFIKAL